MFEALRTHVRRHIELTDDDFTRATRFFIPKKLRKSQFLLREGDLARAVAFVTSGCLRLYRVDEKGEEHVVQFAVEEWWISDLYSVLTGEPATYCIDALEDSELLLLEASAQESLCIENPCFERFFRLLLQNSYIASQRRISAGLSLSAEEQYLRFVKMYPTIANRVPLKDIASFLGITPQSLSRIRRELVRGT